MRPACCLTVTHGLLPGALHRPRTGVLRTGGCQFRGDSGHTLILVGELDSATSTVLLAIRNRGPLRSTLTGFTYRCAPSEPLDEPASAPQVLTHSPNGLGGGVGIVALPPELAPGIGAQPCTPCPPIGYIPGGQFPSALADENARENIAAMAACINRPVMIIQPRPNSISSHLRTCMKSPRRLGTTSQP